MMRIKHVLLTLLLMAGCFYGLAQSIRPKYKKEADGIVLSITKPRAGAPQLLRLRIVSEDIIQVLTSPNNAFTADTSLMVVADSPSNTEWTVSEKGSLLSVSTKNLQAVIDGTNGEITFLDSNGNLLLRENNKHLTQFKPVTFGQEQSYQLQQSFLVAADEAFYGLGQHQTGLMNYRGYQVDLTQYNGVAVVPFMVSSNNYGILWDNNSITKAGDVRLYQPLSALALYDTEGKKGGLTANYGFLKSSEVKQAIVLQESTIDYEFLHSLKKLPQGYSLQDGKVTWEGQLQSNEEGEHVFRLQASGYVKIWIDNKLLLDRWREAWNPGPSVIKHFLGKGKKHAIKIEWIPDGGEAFISLTYLPPLSMQDQQLFSFSSEAGDQINYYFIRGKNLDGVIKGYRKLTGAAQVLPKWAMGFWQSRERYKTQEEILETVKEFRRRQIPLDNIVLDWSYWKEDQWGSQEFDPSRFPDPEAMIRELHEEHNAHIMISVWPKFYEGIKTYQQFNEKGLLYTQNITNRQRDWIGQGYVSTFYDAFNPKARELFWGLLNRKLFSKGIDAWWLDATEPDILSNASIDHRKSLMNPTYLGASDKYFNAYSLVNAQGIYEGQRQVNPNQRVFILTRSAFAGLQRYGAATWSGDISARFDEMARQIPAGLNFSLSGLPYWTTDIGGFFVENKYDRPDPQGKDLEEWRELNTRWYQFGAFCPLFRSHGQYPYREVFNIAPEDHLAYKSIVYYNKLRYRLMPYIYSLTGQVHHQDYTIMRALVMDFGQDKNVREISDQYMFGPSLLVSPVTEYKARSRKLYLPAGTGWYNFYDGSFHKGGMHINAAAPYEQMPLFVKEGSIIPFGPEIQYTAEKPADPITLYVYAGRDAQFELYEDEGTNYDYEQGQFSTIAITYTEADKSLQIGERQGSFAGMPEQRSFRVIYIDKANPKKTDFQAAPAAQTINYTGKSTTIKLKN